MIITPAMQKLLYASQILGSLRTGGEVNKMCLLSQKLKLHSSKWDVKRKVMGKMGFKLPLSLAQKRKPE